MGGKGGGGDGGASSSRAQWAKDTAQNYYNLSPTGKSAADPNTGYAPPSFKDQFESNRPNYRNINTGAYDNDLWFQNKGGAGFDWSKNLFDLYYPTNPYAAPAPAAAAPAAAEAPAAAPAPAAAAPTDTTPVATAPAPTPSGSTGSQLGGAITNPPGYWVGDMSNYVNARKNAGTGGTTGAIQTTQT